MSQWGAVGYAVDRGWDWTQILDHYYGGTVLSRDAGNGLIDVRLESRQGQTLLVTGPVGSLTISGSAGVLAGGQSAVQVARLSPGVVRVFTAPGCGGPWSALADIAGRVSIASAASVAYGDLVQLCDATGLRAYRGELAAIDDGTKLQTVNRVVMEDYLRGVVPRESPAYFGDLGGGRGINALRAQAVAARSYAYSEQRWSYAKTCDTTSCQVYGGAAWTPYGQAAQILEDARTDRAVAETAGTVRRFPSGVLARTEFSSSSGGWTAGGTFPAVLDEGDSYAGNKNYMWSTQITVGQLRSALGLPGFASLQVTSRNGLGDWGGRVQEVALDTGSGTVVVSGNTMRSKLGLKSDWFTITGLPSSQDQRFVAALYLDFLGRGADQGGLDMWSTAISSGALSRYQATMGFANSPERVGYVVDRLYLEILGRSPDPAGRAGWVSAIRSGLPVSEVAAAFYASPEVFSGRAGSSLPAWVGLMYSGILGRQVDPGGLATWTAAAAALGRLEVARSLYQSPESLARRVSGLYAELLGRAPDPSGLQTWPSVIKSQGDIALAANLAASEEYYLRSQSR
jgi:SpoIID/LytB domain protein